MGSERILIESGTGNGPELLKKKIKFKYSENSIQTESVL